MSGVSAARAAVTNPHERNPRAGRKRDHESALLSDHILGTVTAASGIRLTFVFLRVIARHPTLAPELCRFAASVSRRDWMRRWPFLPLPDRRYRDWRILDIRNGVSVRPEGTDELGVKIELNFENEEAGGIAPELMASDLPG